MASISIVERSQLRCFDAHCDGRFQAALVMLDVTPDVSDIPAIAMRAVGLSTVTSVLVPRLL